METAILITHYAEKSPGFHFLVTTFEGEGDNTLAIHGNNLECSIHMTTAQAINLIDKLQEGIIRLKAHELSRRDQP